MSDEFDMLLKEALTPKDIPDEKLNDKVFEKINKRIGKHYGRRVLKTLIPAFIILAFIIISSTAVIALPGIMNPGEVARMKGDYSLAEAFKSPDAIYCPQEQISGDYKISLLGCVAGKNLSQYERFHNGKLVEDQMYIVVSIELLDADKKQESELKTFYDTFFYTGIFVGDEKPFVGATLSFMGHSSATVVDNVKYIIREVDNLEIFADRGLYVFVNQGSMPDWDSYSLNEETGEITLNDNAVGVHALFELPMNTDKADYDKAEEILNQIKGRN